MIDTPKTEYPSVRTLRLYLKNCNSRGDFRQGDIVLAAIRELQKGDKVRAVRILRAHSIPFGKHSLKGEHTSFPTDGAKLPLIREHLNNNLVFLAQSPDAGFLIGNGNLTPKQIVYKYSAGRAVAGVRVFRNLKRETPKRVIVPPSIKTKDLLRPYGQRV